MVHVITSIVLFLLSNLAWDSAPTQSHSLTQDHRTYPLPATCQDLYLGQQATGNPLLLVQQSFYLDPREEDEVGPVVAFERAGAWTVVTFLSDRGCS